MTPVRIIRLPHNGCCEFYDPGEGPSFDHYEPGEPRRPAHRGTDWATLPIPMPHHVLMITDHDGRVIAATADGQRIRWADLDIVLTGIRQFNADCRSSRDPNADR